jgi:hypothetical protein
MFWILGTSSAKVSDIKKSPADIKLGVLGSQSKKLKIIQ